MKFALTKILTILVLHFVVASAAFAGGDPIFLFPPVATQPSNTDELLPVRIYEEIVKNLVSGDVLGFEDGNRFEYLGFVGHGETSNILHVKALTGTHSGSEMVLRIPLKATSLKCGQGWYGEMLELDVDDPAYRLNYSHYVNSALEYAELFAQTKIGPKFFGGFAGQYVALERINREFTLDEYVSRKVKLSNAEDEVVQTALERFERKTAGISSINDIAQPGQVVYDGKEFVLVDWYGVRLVEDGIYPWGFLTVGIDGKTLISDGMTARGLAAELLRSYEIRGDQWQQNLHTRLMRTHAMARLDMLEARANSLTGKPLLRDLSIYNKYFTAWRKIFAEMSRTRKERACNRILVAGKL